MNKVYYLKLSLSWWITAYISPHLPIFSGRNQRKNVCVRMRDRVTGNAAIITSTQRLNTHNKHQRKWRFDMDIWTKDWNATYLFDIASIDREKVFFFQFLLMFFSFTFWTRIAHIHFLSGCSIELKYTQKKTKSST